MIAEQALLISFLSFSVFFFSAVDHCFSNPCRNNRTCTSFLNHYECDCGEDFSGTNCEEGLFICLKLYLCFMFAGNSVSPSQITKNQVLGCSSSKKNPFLFYSWSYNVGGSTIPVKIDIL